VLCDVWVIYIDIVCHIGEIGQAQQHQMVNVGDVLVEIDGEECLYMSFQSIMEKLTTKTDKDRHIKFKNISARQNNNSSKSGSGNDSSGDSSSDDEVANVNTSTRSHGSNNNQPEDADQQGMLRSSTPPSMVDCEKQIHNLQSRFEREIEKIGTRFPEAESGQSDMVVVGRKWHRRMSKMCRKLQIWANEWQVRMLQFA
jgi:hypothetical protein